ncbi:NYN domain-containing protein [Allofranklinella schreckenbergeri]|uniref:NYN domain-containing protein n=1 Tax=Allofranklinella schreckenbergeri TaxID=1076744 RepID=A0A3M6Q8W4_9BURK|nr:NYN domain-containing protein [Allofranklinella schreckenbergeri]RMW99386.1 NYN domain-containing protein [Allofranklinella schreckenbergeri]
MKNSTEKTGVAIYWDFENMHLGLVSNIMGHDFYNAWRKQSDYSGKELPELVDVARVVEYVQSSGDILINRAYGNWQKMSVYRNALTSQAIDLVQLFPAGNGAKNGGDIRMAMDVMEDIQCYGEKIDTVVIVSGDSDFIPLVSKMKFHRKRLVGVGSQASASLNWIRACDEFMHYERLMPVLNPRFNPVECLKKLVGQTKSRSMKKHDLAFAFYKHVPGLDVRALIPGESIVEYMDYLNRQHHIWDEYGSGLETQVSPRKLVQRPGMHASRGEFPASAAASTLAPDAGLPVQAAQPAQALEAESGMGNAPQPGAGSGPAARALPDGKVLIGRAIDALQWKSKPGGWVNMANMTGALRNEFPVFKPDLYGFLKLSEFIESCGFEMGHVDGSLHCRRRPLVEGAENEAENEAENAVVAESESVDEARAQAREKEALDILQRALRAAAREKNISEGWVDSREMFQACRKIQPDFHLRNYFSGSYVDFLQKQAKIGALDYVQRDGVHWYRVHEAEEAAADEAAAENGPEVLDGDAVMPAPNPVLSPADAEDENAQEDLAMENAGALDDENAMEAPEAFDFPDHMEATWQLAPFFDEPEDDGAGQEVLDGQASDAQASDGHALEDGHPATSMPLSDAMRLLPSRAQVQPQGAAQD